MTQAKSIWRVAVLEDEPATRAYFCRSVRACAGFALVAEFDLVESARAWLVGNSIDLLVTDLSLPDGNALPLVREMRQQQPCCEVLVVSLLGDDETVFSSIKAGASGYIQKDASVTDIGRLIEMVRSGGSPISPNIARRVLARLQTPQMQPAAPAPVAQPLVMPSGSAAPGVLTSRELDVLSLFAKGYSYAEAAKVLEVGLATIQTHVRAIYGKLQVHSRGEAVFEASRRNLLKGLEDLGKF